MGVWGCASPRAYQEVSWVRPKGLNWLESADFVLACYNAQTGDDAKAEDLAGVTVHSAKSNAYFGSLQISLIYAKDVDSVRHGLALHLARVRAKSEDPRAFIEDNGLCFGYCYSRILMDTEKTSACVY